MEASLEQLTTPLPPWSIRAGGFERLELPRLQLRGAVAARLWAHRSKASLKNPKTICLGRRA